MHKIFCGFKSLPYLCITNSTLNEQHMKTLTTATFTKALQHAEVSANYDLDGQWAVCTKYGVFLACPLAYAIDKDYHIVSITIY